MTNFEENEIAHMSRCNQFMGERAVEGTSWGRFRKSNPLNLPSQHPVEFREDAAEMFAGKAEYHLLRNNCHYHAQAVLKDLGF